MARLSNLYGVWATTKLRGTVEAFRTEWWANVDGVVFSTPHPQLAAAQAQSVRLSFNKVEVKLMGPSGEALDILEES